MSVTTELADGTAKEQITVRPFRRADTGGFLDLYEAVWDRRRSREWFEWRFLGNPYLATPPLIVATTGDRLVGAEPCLPFRLRAGDETVPAFQPADWIVHPDYRRQGVFTRMTEALLDGGNWEPPAVYFNFPTAELQPGLEKFDWQMSGRIPSYCRLQRPSPLISNHTSHLPRPVPRILGRAADTAAAVGCRLRDLAGPTPDIEVTRHEQLPLKTLATLYRSYPPSGVHVVRDERFYGWRFDNPDWETAAYLAHRDGRPVAGLITCTERTESGERTILADTLPLDANAEQRATTALVRAVVENSDADFLRTSGAGLPRPALRSLGFRPMGAPPLSSVTNPTTLAVRPGALDGQSGDAPAGEAVDERVDAWTLGGHRLDNAANWRLAEADQDIA